MHKLERKTISHEKLITFALDIARGMQYIHSQGVIHRDLKPENILIGEDSRLILADFGIACEEAVCDLLADDPGTYRWMAPEMIKRKSYGRKVDVYSFGLILWELLTGTIPYEDMNPIQAAFAVVNKVHSFRCIHIIYDRNVNVTIWFLFFRKFTLIWIFLNSQNGNVIINVFILDSLISFSTKILGCFVSF